MKLYSKFILASFFTFALSTTAFAESKEVRNFNEFKEAYENPNITHISVLDSFEFKNDVEIKQGKDMTIDFNADKGVVINLGLKEMKAKTKDPHTLSIINANLIGKDFAFKSLYDGWNLYVKDTKYEGFIFADIRLGTLTFDGTNEINTKHENARVNHVVFKENSVFRSFSGGTDAAFEMKKGTDKADGTAIIEKGAKTYFYTTDINQPVFGDHAYKIIVSENALFDVDAEGYAIYFSDVKTHYLLGEPHLIVEKGATVNIRQHNDKKLYPPIKFSDLYVNSGFIEVKEGANFYVSGYKKNEGVIQGKKEFKLIINKPNDLDIRNNYVNSPALSGKSKSQYIKVEINESEIKAWNKTNKQDFYDDNKPDKTWSALSGNLTIDFDRSSEVNTDNADFNMNFKNENYGRIALKGGIPAPKEYLVSFDALGGSPVPATQNIKENELALEPIAPEKKGSCFVGWTIDRSTEILWDFDFDRVVENITLFAVWQERPQTYAVIFDSNNGSYVDPIANILYGSTINKPTNPTRDNYIFIGWYKDNNFVELWDFDNDIVTEDITLYAEWMLKRN